MALDYVVQSLQEVIDGSESAFQHIGGVFDAYRTEYSLRPALLRHIRFAPLVMDYLSLDEETKCRVQDFQVSFPKFLGGRSSGHAVKGFWMSDRGRRTRARRLLSRTRLANLAVRFYDFYEQHHGTNERFGMTYFFENPAFLKRFGEQGKALYQSAFLLFSGGYQEFSCLVELVRPGARPKMYTLQDAARDVIMVFDDFVKVRDYLQVFSLRQLNQNKVLRSKFGDVIDRMAVKARAVGGFSKLIREAGKTRTSIRKYASSAELILREGHLEVVRMFDFYLEHHQPSEEFCTWYLLENKSMREAFGTKCWNLYAHARRHIGPDGMQKLVRRAAVVRPEIRKYWSYTASTRHHPHSEDSE